MTATAAPLQARISRLEQIVSQLQAQSGGGEQLSPNYLTLSPTGQVGANFTGLINALGLILPAGAGGPVPPEQTEEQVVWEVAQPGPDPVGSVVGAVTAFDDQTGSQGISVSSQAQSSPDTSSALIRALGTTAGVEAKLQVLQVGNGSAGPAGAIGAGTEVDVFVEPGAGAMLLDILGRSSFVQCNDQPSQTALTGGTGNVVWPGGSPNSQVTSINYTLSRTPQFVVATPFDVGPQRFGKIAVTAITPVFISFQAQSGDLSSPGAGTTMGFTWLAVG